MFCKNLNANKQKTNTMRWQRWMLRGNLDTADEQGVAIQPDLQIKEFLHLFLCHQRVQNTFVDISILIQLEMKAQLRQKIMYSQRFAVRIREAFKKKYGIIWEFSPNVGPPPPFGNASFKMKFFG